MKVVSFGIVIGQQCYHHNPESKRHAMKLHVYSVLVYMLAIYINCLLTVSHSRQACGARNNNDAVRPCTRFSPANPQAVNYMFRLHEAGRMYQQM